LGETGGLLLTVATSVLVIEGAVAALLFPRMLLNGADPWTAAWQSVYTAAMAFTNTGFLPGRDGIAPYAHDVWYLVVLMIGVVFGAIGFPVIYALRKGWRTPRHWSLHVRLTLATFGILTVGGAVVYFLIEFNNPQTMAGMDPGQRVLQSRIDVVGARGGRIGVEVLEQVAGVFREERDRSRLDLGHVRVALPDVELALHLVPGALERLGVDLGDDRVRVVVLRTDDDRVARSPTGARAGLIERVAR
jgi:hypothetical protein